MARAEVTAVSRREPSVFCRKMLVGKIKTSYFLVSGLVTCVNFEEELCK